MKLIRIALVIFFLLQCSSIAFAQADAAPFADSLLKKFDYYSAKKQQGVLFAHFDKNVYTNNENVWFTAYLLNTNANKNDVLSLILINDNGHSILLKDKFVMDKGIAFGNLFLPDSVLSGNYSFILYTNSVIKGEPQNVFIQAVTIKNTNTATFKTTLFLQDTAKVAPPGGRRILLFTNGMGKIIAGATVKYTVGDKRKPIVQGTVKTDNAGQYTFTIPDKNISAVNNVLEAKITFGKEVQLVKLNLPVRVSAPVVKFYPEGGNLADRITSIVGWEVTSTQGNPYAVNGVLYQDDKPIDTISTNSYGMGSFVLQPNIQSRYYVKLIRADAKDSIYKLPAVLNNSPVVSISQAVVNDTLKLVIKSKSPGKFYVVVHNYKDLFYSFPVQVQNDRRIKVGLAGIPKGLAEITILDSLQRPYAERLFFAHYDQKNVVNIDIDSSAYKTRQKVNLKLDLTDANGKPITGAVSIACIQANRQEIKKSTDIESYFYLNNDLGNLPVKQNYLGNDAADKAFLENVLLIKGWRRYTWADMIQTTPKDTIQQLDSLSFKGKVTHFDALLKKPISYIIFKNGKPNIGVTKADGTFALNNADIEAPVGKNVQIYASGDVNDYTFKVPDPYDMATQLLAAGYEPINYNYSPANGHTESTEDLKWLANGKLLKEVKIKGVNDSLTYGRNAFGTNACGDYVCMNRILNCPNHVGNSSNTIPIQGQMYIYGGVKMIYSGCNINEQVSLNKPVEAIHYTMEFYPADYAQLSPAAPEYLSTIYWKELYNISSGKENNISFYTSDIIGDFKIIVQGITDKGVVYGEKTFTVKK